MKKKYLKRLIAYQQAEIEKLQQASIPSRESNKTIIEIKLMNEHIIGVYDNLTSNQFKELMQMHVDKEKAYITGVQIS